MNKDIVQGKWKEMKGQIKQQWGKLTDDDLDQINGKKDELAGRIQKYYGKSREEADQAIDQFFSSNPEEDMRKPH